MTTEHEPNIDTDTNEKRESLHIWSAFFSAILPGLGQLTQRRDEAFTYHLLFYCVAMIVPCLMIIDWVQESPPGVFYALPKIGVFLICPALIMFFSLLDAACWQQGRWESPLRKPTKRLFVSFVVIYTLLFLGALLIPFASSAREATRRLQCTSNLKQIALALHTYHDVYKSFPPAYTTDAEGRPLHSWRVLLLPYLEQATLYESIRLDEPWDSEYNKQFHHEKLSCFACPTYSIVQFLKDRHPNLQFKENCYYSVIVGEGTMFPGTEAMPLKSITDGTSNTLVVVERLVPVCWMNPVHEISLETACEGINTTLVGIGSGHIGGCNAAFADGSMRFLPDSLTPDELRALFTRNGGEEFHPF